MKWSKNVKSKLYIIELVSCGFLEQVDTRKFLARNGSAQRYSLSWWLRNPEEFNLFENHVRNASFVACLKNCEIFIR